ncbi:hypothetical protein ACV1BL_16800 [Serratia marcescens]
MDNKLSELSKPVAWKFKNADGGDRVSLERKANIYGRHNFQPCYSQEYVSALRADAAKWFKAFEKAVSVGARYEERIAELEERLKLVREQRDNELRSNAILEMRLATPVRLPTTSGRLGVAYTRVIPEVIEAIRAAGFTVEGDA